MELVPGVGTPASCQPRAGGQNTFGVRGIALGSGSNVHGTVQDQGRRIFKTGLTRFTGLCLPAPAGVFWICFGDDFSWATVKQGFGGCCSRALVPSH